MAGKKPIITLLRHGNRLVIDPSTADVRAIIEPKLSFTAKIQLHGAALYIDENRGLKTKLVDYKVFTIEHKGRIATALGFYDRIVKALTYHGYQVKTKNLLPHPKPEVFQPQWDRLYDPQYGIQLRPTQEDFLFKFFARLQLGLPGCFDCSPGVGKSFLIGVIALLLPKAKIHYTSKRASVLRTRIYPELCGMLPSVGLVGAGMHKKGCRVQGYSFDSMHHSDGKCDILIIDEAAEVAADSISEEIGRYDEALCYGLSATFNQRLDNKDLRVEAICGPVIHKVGYQEAAGHGLVVPLEVIWTDVTMDMNPCAGIDNPVERKRAGIWRNEYRNALIAADVMKYTDEQVMITCETIEHALALKQQMPDVPLVYAARDISVHKKNYFRREGIWPDGGLKPMTPERLQMLTRLFERGKLRKVIVTTVWNVGVSMNHLEVVVRADAGGSKINDTQIPGRASRTNEAIGKIKGIIRDYRDNFDTGFKAKSTKRHSSYAANGWKQTDWKKVTPKYEA